MTLSLIIATTITLTSILILTCVNGLGSAPTLAVLYGPNITICGIAASEPTQHIRCYHNSRVSSLLPKISFEEIAGGESFFCGLSLGGLTLLCWDETFRPKRVFHSKTVSLTGLAVGDQQVCASEVDTGVARCWRGREWSTIGHDIGVFLPPRFSRITCGSGFVCGILRKSSKVLCWGSIVGAEIQSGFGNLSMLSLVAGEFHACGLTMNGSLVCKGNNNSGQLNVPSSISSNYELSGLALGGNFTCAIRQRNGIVTCWGDGNRFQLVSQVLANLSFESVVAGLDLVCGLTTTNLSIVCWGKGWSKSHNLPLGTIAPGPCVESSCKACGTYPDSQTLCSGAGKICKSCHVELPFAAPLPPRIKGKSTNSTSWHYENKKKLRLALLVFGIVGCIAGLWSVSYCLWRGVIERRLYRGTENNSSNTKTVDSIGMSPTKDDALVRQTSVASKPEIFAVSELASATNGFALGNKIGSGSFGVVYRGRLADGREVAVKRGEARSKKSFQEKESAFESELVVLSRLHHKHLVSLLGFCEESDERLLVFEYMPNGSVHHHLHGRNDGVLMSWQARIRIALEAARGVEYLHDYAVPPIIHRDIKSSNILLDSTWTAKVSDFGLSLPGPEAQQESEYVPTKAVGTVGYIDPEYYVLNVLTTKSDVYGLGVVMLELLTGKRAVFRVDNEGESGVVLSVVDYVERCIVEGGIEGLNRVFDERVGVPVGPETRAVEVLASIAMRCVRLEGSERPCGAEIVAVLERAFAICSTNDG